MTEDEIADHCMLMYPLVSQPRAGVGGGTIEYGINHPTKRLFGWNDGATGCSFEDVTKDHPDFWPMCLEVMYIAESHVQTGVAIEAEWVLGSKDKINQQWYVTRDEVVHGVTGKRRVHFGRDNG